MERRRRESALSGAQAVARLTNSIEESVYSHRAANDTPHTPLRPCDVDEPCSEVVVPLLEALPWDDREFYGKEENLIAPDSSPQVFAELEQHYGFVGGAYDDYVA